MLVVIALLAKMSAPRHDQQWLAFAKRADDRPHAGMRDNMRGRMKARLELGRRKIGHPIEILWTVTGRPRIRDLAKDVPPAPAPGPEVDVADKPVEGKLRANGQEDHSTAPE